MSSEEAATDSEYEVDDDALDGLGNTALIEGRTGSGKTAAVFALAAEMGFNVLEVNASSNRTGKQVKYLIFLVANGLCHPCRSCQCWRRPRSLSK